MQWLLIALSQYGLQKSCLIAVKKLDQRTLDKIYRILHTSQFAMGYGRVVLIWLSVFWSVLFIINLQLDSLASISVNDFHNVLLAKKVQEVIEQIEVICIVLFTIYECTAVNKNYLWNTEEKKQKWVPADVDFVVCFWSNCRFFRWNHCMLRIDLCGYVISELCTTTNQPQ